MKVNPNLVRDYVLLAIDVCRLVCWGYVVVNLITNYKRWPGAQLR